jgi:hypothetical protein
VGARRVLAREGWCARCGVLYEAPPGTYVFGVLSWLNSHWMFCPAKATWTPPIPGVEYDYTRGE